MDMLRSVFAQTLENKVLTAASPIVGKNLGFPYGNVYFVKLSPDAEDIAALPQHDSPAIIMPFNKAKEIIDMLDSESQGRKTNNLFNFFVSGNFIAARTDANAMHHYHLYARSLHRPVAYMKNVFQEMDTYFANKDSRIIKKTIRCMVRGAVAKGFFNLTEIPPELEIAFSTFDTFFDGDSKSLEARVKNRLSAAFSIATPLLYLSPFFMGLKNAYYTNSRQFLLNQAPVILKELNAFAEGDAAPHNIITLSIIELIKEEHALYRTNIEELKAYLLTLNTESVLAYLKKPEMLALPGTLGATENLTMVFENTLQTLHGSQELLEKLQARLKDLFGDITFTADNVERIKALFEKDEATNGYLHRFYLELLRREDIKKSVDYLRSESMLIRYTAHAIHYGDYTIPGGSSIVFLPAIPRFDERLYQSPDVFDPDRYLLKTNQHLEKYPITIFNESKRRCPAAALSSYISKMFISHLVLHYDFTLQKEKEADPWPTLMQVTAKQKTEPMLEVAQEANKLTC
jgi:hypothetical protein